MVYKTQQNSQHKFWDKNCTKLLPEKLTVQYETKQHSFGIAAAVVTQERRSSFWWRISTKLTLEVTVSDVSDADRLRRSLCPRQLHSSRTLTSASAVCTTYQQRPAGCARINCIIVQSLLITVLILDLSYLFLHSLLKYTGWLDLTEVLFVVVEYLFHHKQTKPAIQQRNKFLKGRQLEGQMFIMQNNIQ